MKSIITIISLACLACMLASSSPTEKSKHANAFFWITKKMDSPMKLYINGAAVGTLPFIAKSNQKKRMATEKGLAVQVTNGNYEISVKDEKNLTVAKGKLKVFLSPKSNDIHSSWNNDLAAVHVELNNP